MSGLAKRVSVSEGINRYPPQTHHTQCLASKDNRDQIERTIIVMIMINGVAELGSLSSGAKMAMKIFVKRVFTILASNASFLRVIANLQN